VLYADGASSASGRAAITRAGGTLTDENAAIGLAEVTSTDAAFLGKVRASKAVKLASRNRSMGTARPGMGHKYKDERLDDERAARKGSTAQLPVPSASASAGGDPLSDLQWDMQMIHATPDGSYGVQPGDHGVLVGVIDTGIDGSHPDIAPNFNAALSRNFTTDIPAIDGPCEEEADHSCTDANDVDEDGHGTHVAGTIAAPLNGFGMAGVAPGVQLVNLRAGQDSGYFFVEQSTEAITYAADNGIDVVNMSFYIDPWLYNCPSADDYLTHSGGHPTAEEITEQQLILAAVNEAVDYAHAHDVTMIAAAGNEHTDLSAPKRRDDTSPDFLLEGDQLVDGAYSRQVSSSCLDVPSEAPHVLSVSSVGPSGQKADYSNWGIDEIDVAAPGGWYRDLYGTDQFRQPENMILGPYPKAVGVANGDIDPVTGEPTNEFIVQQCSDPTVASTCAYYQWIQGTSMASPHAVGVAALIIAELGQRDGAGNASMSPDAVRDVLKGTATDHACSRYNYGLVGRAPAGQWNVECRGDTSYNNVYGDGIIDALAAVSG
jgi:subtilisin family serine protease